MWAARSAKDVRRCRRNAACALSSAALTYASECGSKVRSVSPVAGLIVAILTNCEASPGVPKVPFCDAELWSFWITEVHVLPADIIDAVHLTSAKGARDRTDQTPGRQSLNECGRADQEGLDPCIIVNSKLLYATDDVVVDVAHLGAKQKLDVHVHSIPPPPNRRPGFAR